jgi:hypothetical protein
MRQNLGSNCTGVLPRILFPLRGNCEQPYKSVVKQPDAKSQRPEDGYPKPEDFTRSYLKNVFWPNIFVGASF